jgi:hypothetical protein
MISKLLYNSPKKVGKSGKVFKTTFTDLQTYIIIIIIYI